MSEKIKVSELEASTTTNDSDLIMIVQENSNNELENFKQTRANFFAGLDLTDYVQNDDYAEVDKGGVIKIGMYGFNMDGDNAGHPKCGVVNYSSYQSSDNGLFISKGTLENVLNAKIGDINNALDLINGESI